ncbi:dihydrofolate reductase family protein [Rhizobium halophytocola]|uniref:Dihydrofolate reductase n=1 Tax=Rhizobium halophytocola TaxID=735519 RepID=A0ABS4DTM2_9HYPH|nr:dihydrofolate reductase family protein [Rhizobium halophytocola]MBP1849044.1 dihydrofolate reductase [Rhizobium halophytocola]
MRTIRIIEHISLDGVIQAPGGPDEDRDSGFAHGGWAMRYGDPVVRTAIEAAHGEGFDLLLGRRTYDIWSGYWPHAAPGPMADSFNRAVKFVATHRPDSLSWGPVEPLGPDPAASLRAIKAKDGADIVVWGSSSLPAMLLENGLADEVVLLVYPVMLGTGKRIFTERASPSALTLLESRQGESGVVVNRYAPSAPPPAGAG